MTTSAVLALANAWLYVRHPRPVWRYLRRNGRLPYAAAPRSYSERMLWRKIVDRSPHFVRATDKLACKEYVGSVCPDLSVPETLWVGTDPGDIPDSLLMREPEVWVKANHGCGFNLRVRGGEPARERVEHEARRWLASVYGGWDSNWAYSAVPPRIFVEESVGDARTDLLEFNVRASAGRPVRGSVIGHNKLEDQWTVYLDLEGRPVPAADGTPPKVPPGIDFLDAYLEAVEHTTRLSRDMDYARYDFFWNGRTLYAGEITIYPGGGVAEILDPEFRNDVLDAWDLRDAHFLRHPPGGLGGVYARALRRRVESRRRVGSLSPAEVR